MAFPATTRETPAPCPPKNIPQMERQRGTKREKTMSHTGTPG